MSSAHREYLNTLWASKDDAGNPWPLSTSEIMERINRVRERQNLGPLSPSSVSVAVKEMREKGLLDVFRFIDGRPQKQASSQDIEAALAKRDRLTAYWPAITPEQIGGTEDRWDAGHRAFLARHSEKLFKDTFSLDDIFISPLAFWTEAETFDNPDAKRDDSDRPAGRIVKYKRHVVDLMVELHGWLMKPNDTVRVLEGPPGAGKSSVARTLAAELIRAGTHRVLYVPLHELEPSGQPEAELDRFAVEHAYPVGVLDPNPDLPPLLVCFDGLDELQQTDTDGKSLAYMFAAKYQPALDRCRANGRHVHALYCGRPIAAHHLQALFTDSRQYFELLPFFTPEDERPTEYGEGTVKYTTADKTTAKLFARDRRDDWWRKFAREPMPELLKDKKLRDFTVLPLLITLLALAYRDRAEAGGPATKPGDPVPPNPFANGKLPERMADVYAWLLRKVYNREWGTPASHVTTRPLSFLEFRSLLGLLGLAAWHTGDGRTSTVPAVETLAAPLWLRGRLEKYRKEFRKGTVGLFLSFFYRHLEKINGVETFQFTIKPFAEHLAAVGLVDLLAALQRRLGEPKKTDDDDADEPWTAAELAEVWLTATGPGILTEELDRHVQGEAARRAAHEAADAAKWRIAATELLAEVANNGFPIKVADRANSREIFKRCRNAEYALVQALAACERAAPLPSIRDRTPPEDWRESHKYNSWSETNRRWLAMNSDCFICIRWASPVSAAEMLRRIRSPQSRWYRFDSRPDPLDLGKFDLLDQWLIGADLTYARLDGARLDDARLVGARLVGASLDGASLVRARLDGASLVRASLDGARLDGARLDDARLVGASLDGASLDGASLNGASLNGASLNGASLDGARLNGADFSRATLLGATYGGVRLDSAKGVKLLRSMGAINVPVPTFHDKSP